MRWLVEVTALGKSEKQQVFVDAESWQKALQAARSQRGEAGPMSGFSIELLDEGCRAVDPMSRLRYEVRRAPDGASVPPPAVAHPPAAAPAASAPSRPAPPAAKKAPGAARTMMMGSSAGAAAVEPAAPHAPVAVTPPHAPPAAGPQIIYKREQDPTETMPLTYREYVFLVPPGTSEAAAESLLLTQFEMVRASLGDRAGGKLVNLAVFDLLFKGKPPVPPLATLNWKDWRGGPVMAHPRRAPAPPVEAPAPVPAPAPMAAPVAFAPAAPVAQPPQAPAAFAPTLAASAPAFPAPALPAPPLPGSAPAQSAQPQPPWPQQPPPQFAPAPQQQPFAQPPQAFAPQQPAFVPQQPAFVPQQAAVQQQPSRPPTPVRMNVTPTPGRGFVPRVRVRGEDLIADLFESMHDLHFVRDAVEGGDFCLSLAMEKLPSQVGIVHLYDIDRREFLVTSVRGAATGKLLLQRHPENDLMISAAMRKRRAVVVADASQGETATVGRYATVGGARSLIIAPVMQAGRFLGAIELLNPLDGGPYTESEGNAVSYIAEQFAEFVAERGVVTDPEVISSRQLPGA
jgi:hypothetical protein